VGLIPTAWWNYLGEKFKVSSVAMKTLYYDGQSELARKLGLIAKELLLLDSVKVLPSHLNPQMGGFFTSGQSFVLQDEGSKIITNHSILYQLLLSSRILPLRLIGKIANSEISLSLSDAKETGEVSLFSDKPVESKTSTSSFQTVQKLFSLLFDIIGFDKVKFKLNKFERFMGGFLLILVIGWNIEGYMKDRKWSIGSPFDEIMFALNLSQGWAMFAPHPQRVDGWWVMDGTLKNGKNWDAFNNKAVSFDRPSDMYETYPTDNWRKFLDNIQGTRNMSYFNLLGSHICRRWNSLNRGDGSLKSFKMYFMREFTNGPGEPQSPVEKVLLVDQTCL
jgi:hypothetical protein